MLVMSVLRGPSCPNCEGDPDGIVHQQGLHQDPIVQCFHCAARIYCEGEFRHVIPEDRAPAIRADFLTPRPFNDGLDGFNRQIGTYEVEAEQYERKARYWRQMAEGAKARRAAYMGLVPAKSDGIVAGVQGPLTGSSGGDEVVAKGPVVQ